MRGARARWSASRVEAEHPEPARRRAAVALEALDGRGLAGPVGSEEGEHLAGIGPERQPVDRGDRPVADDQLLTLDGRAPGAGRGREGGVGRHTGCTLPLAPR